MGATPSRSDALRTCDDGVETPSSVLQERTEQDCLRFYLRLDDLSPGEQNELIESGLLDEKSLQPQLLRSKTVEYLRRGLDTPLGPSYVSLDASRPWLLYWMLHALELLDAFPEDLRERVRAGLMQCRTPGGLGFGGGFMQEGHTAPTYAAVLTVCTLGDAESLALVDRAALYRFFMGLKDESGGFRVQRDGEMDTRGLYTVLAVASITNILTPELTANCAEFVGRCQTFEGGIGGEPGNEAHGGYAFCALAALVILERFDTIDVDAFVDWIAARQMRLEGGYQGRTNKLVDACYSFWQGAIPALLETYLDVKVPPVTEAELAAAEAAGRGEELDTGSLLTAQTRLQQYLLLCCQFREGGLRDKPETHRDQYHTCYALSGLSVAQDRGKQVWGAATNRLRETHPVYNVQVDKLEAAMAHFRAQPPIETLI